MQRTISQAVQFTGLGLHSGKDVIVKMLPHHANGGVVFRRVDIDPPVEIPALATNVTQTNLSSCISVKHHSHDESVCVGTVEHLMSALAAVGIDNIMIEISANEVPIMDGSAAPFINILQSAGFMEQEAVKQFIKIIKPISVTSEDKVATLLPHNSFSIDFEIDFDHPALKNTPQKISVDLAEECFISMISEARTFGFTKDIEYLRANNLALGGSLDNAIVLDDEKILNNEGLRFKDEFVRHKLLDAVGDLYLAGYQILGKLEAYKSGHYVNNLLARKILDNPDCFEIVSSQDIEGVCMLYPSIMTVAKAC